MDAYSSFQASGNPEISSVRSMVESLIKSIEHREGLDRWPVLKELSQDHRGVGIERVANMLRMFLKLVPDDTTSSIENLYGLHFRWEQGIASEVKLRGKPVIPLRLVVLAALFSHCQLGEPGLQEAKSAEKVLKKLRPGLGPEAANFVAALVAHQTLLRAAWVAGSDDVSEVYPLEGGEVGFPGEDSYVLNVCRALAGTLKEFKCGKLQEFLADGLLLHAICLQCRHHKDPDQKLEKIDLKEWQEELRKQIGKPPHSVQLLFLHYGRGVYRQLRRKRDWKDIVRTAAKKGRGSKNSNITVAFAYAISGYIWAKTNPPIVINKAGPTSPGLPAPISYSVGSFFNVGPEPTELVCTQLGEDFDSKKLQKRLASGVNGTNVLQWALEVESASKPERNDWLSVSRLLFILRVIDSAYPFRRSVKVIPSEMPDLAFSVPVLREPIAIPLPDFQQNANTTQMVVNLVAAMINNFAVSLAAHRVDLEFSSKDLEERWKGSIQDRLKDCGADVIAAYVSQCRHCTTQLGQVVPSAHAIDAGEGIHIVGIDIGGGSVKGGIYDSRTSDLVKGSGFSAITYNKKFKDAHDFAETIYKEIAQKLAAAGYLHAAKALGICWPGPIEDNRRVAATSGILGNFNGLSTRIPDNDAEKIRGILDLAKAFEEGTGKDCFILNDGEADILGRLEKTFARKNRREGEGLQAIIKCGTGLAFGLRYRGEVVQILAELGKATLNLKDKPSGFPPGVFTKYMKALAILEAVGNGTRLEQILKQCGSHEGKSPQQTHSPILVSAALLGKNDAGLERLITKFIQLTEPILKSSKADWHTKAISLAKLEKKFVQTFMARFYKTGRPQLRKEARNAIQSLALHAADAIAAVVQLFRVDRVTLCGGPIRGEFGSELIKKCKLHLEERFGMTVITDGSTVPHSKHPLIVAEPSRIQLDMIEPPGRDSEPGARGAAIAAYRAFFQ